MNCSGHGTSLAQETNRVDIDPELKDDWGVPAIRVTYKDHPDDVKHANWLVQRAVEIMDAAGATQIVPGEVGEANGGVHLLGTCRMGNDPATSVIDKYHRTHDVRNLFLCDGSSMVTSGRGQPTQTIEALAFRAGDHIARFARPTRFDGSALLLRRGGGEIRVLLRHPIDELPHVGVGQERVHIHRVALQLGIGEVGDQRLLANRMHRHDITPAPALRNRMMPDNGLAGRAATEPARHGRGRASSSSRCRSS
jgi:hypothetical protein